MREMLNIAPPRPGEPERILLRVPEVARSLGLSRAFVYQLLAAGELPCVRMGAAVRVPADALRRYVSDHTQPWIEA